MPPALVDRGLHIQVLAHADMHIAGLADDIRSLPVEVVFDHIGWPVKDQSSKSVGFQALCSLLAECHVWVKLSALYRVCDAPFDQMDELVATSSLRILITAFGGSDWPHLMLADTNEPVAAA